MTRSSASTPYGVRKKAPAVFTAATTTRGSGSLNALSAVGMADGAAIASSDRNAATRASDDAVRLAARFVRRATARPPITVNLATAASRVTADAEDKSAINASIARPADGLIATSVSR